MHWGFTCFHKQKRGKTSALKRIRLAFGTKNGSQKRLFGAILMRVKFIFLESIKHGITRNALQIKHQRISSRVLSEK